MAIKIHHGPPGSYKTAGAVTDDLIPALQAGRPIVTNLRGITLERIEEALGDVAASVELIHVDTTGREGREKLGRFFHWVPHGALIFIDEAQAIFPKRWKESDLKAMDMTFEESKEQNRPQNWWDAWDMHRHYNWDIILTTPHISKIRDDIRDASELAYKHKNLGLYGWLFKGSYVEGVHSKDTDGNNSSNFQTVKQKRIRKNATTWKLYQSTATGDISETIAGFNLFSNPRLAIGLAILGYVAYSITARGGDLVTLPTDNLDTQEAPASVPLAPAPSPVEAGSIAAPVDTPSESNPPPVVTHPLGAEPVHYNGYYQPSDGLMVKREPVHMFHATIENRVYTQFELVAMGYTVQEISACLWALKHPNGDTYAKCNYS